MSHVHVKLHRWRLARYVSRPGEVWTQVFCPFCQGLLRLAHAHHVDASGFVTPGVRCTRDLCGRTAQLYLERWDPLQTPTERSEQGEPPPVAEAVELADPDATEPPGA